MAVTVTGDALRQYSKQTVEAFRLVPKDKLDARIWSGEFKMPDGETKSEHAMSAHELALDITAALRFMAEIAGGDREASPNAFDAVRAERDRLAKMSMDEVMGVLEANTEYAADVLDAFPAERAGVELDFGARKMPAGAMALLTFTHLVHHRGQLFQMLRWMGVRPPAFL